MTVADRVVCFGAVLVAVACAPAPTRHGHWDALCANLDPEQVLVPIRTVAPRFPQGLLAEMPSEAWVDVQFSIDDDGSTANLRVLDSVPPGKYDTFALDSLRSWRFCPPSQVAAPYPSALTTRVCFGLNRLGCARCPGCNVGTQSLPRSKPVP